MSTSDELITLVCWVPNVSGGLVTSDIGPRTGFRHHHGETGYSGRNVPPIVRPLEADPALAGV